MGYKIESKDDLKSLNKGLVSQVALQKRFDSLHKWITTTSMAAIAFFFAVLLQIKFSLQEGDSIDYPIIAFITIIVLIVSIGVGVRLRLQSGIYALMDDLEAVIKMMFYLPELGFSRKIDEATDKEMKNLLGTIQVAKESHLTADDFDKGLLIWQVITSAAGYMGIIIYLSIFLFL